MPKAIRAILDQYQSTASGLVMNAVKIAGIGEAFRCFTLEFPWCRTHVLLPTPFSTGPGDRWRDGTRRDRSGCIHLRLHGERHRWMMQA